MPAWRAVGFTLRLARHLCFYLACFIASSIPVVIRRYSWVEHLRLRLHLLLCAPCTAYQRKRRTLSRWMREQTELLPSPTPREVEELQERLREEMKLDRPESNG